MVNTGRMEMMRKGIAAAILTLSLALAGCGGGGSTTTTGTAGGSSPTGQQTISGVAATASTQKLAEQGMTIKAFALDSSGNETFLAQATTGSNGAYSLSLGTYSGAVVLKLFAAGGTTVVRRAALDSVSGSASVAVTPLTELAVRLVESGAVAKTTAKVVTKPLTSTAIRNANALVSDLFNVNIITAQPAELSSQAFQSATTEQRDYALVLAALAQQGSGTTMEPYLTDITTTSRVSATNAAAFTTALSGFLGSSQNVTGVVTPTTNLAAIGDETYYVKLNIGVTTAGTFATGGFLKGVSLTLQLPEGMSVKAGTDGSTLDGVVIGSGSGSPSDPVTTNYVPAARTLAIAYLKDGFGLGEFVTVKCDVAPGKYLLATDFAVSNIYATGSGGVQNPDVTVNVTVSQ